jgi:hypothetical protein
MKKVDVDTGLVQCLDQLIDANKAEYPASEEFWERYIYAALVIQEAIFFRNDPKPDSDEYSTRAVVSLGDIFFWGSAYVSDAATDEIIDLYWLMRNEPQWGSVRWAALREGRRPMVQIVAAMKASGDWDDELEALPAS